MMKRSIALMFAAGALFLAGYCTSLHAQDTNVNSNTNTPDQIVAAIIAEENKPVTPDEIIASIRADTNYFDVGLATRMMKQRSQLIGTLLNIFRDSRATADQKCATAYYLGELHAFGAVNELTTNIALHTTHESNFGEQIWPSIPIALDIIGVPSIPGLIKNLEESDDANVRELSLEVLCSIERDKDVVQLRLQKSLDAQGDATKKARLLAAIKSLPEIKMWPDGIE